MKPESQEALAFALQHVRDAKAKRRSAELRAAVAYVEGVVDGLVSAGELSTNEGALRKRETYEVSDPATKRRRPGRADPRPSRPSTGFLRLVPGPDDPRPFLDGFIRIVAVELFKDHVRVHWNLSPLPSYSAVLGDDLKALDRDTQGLAEEDREHQRFASRMNRLFRLLRFTATDDVGTRYRHSRGGSGGGGQFEELAGVAIFEPALPRGTRSFTVEVHDAKTVIQIA